MSEPRILVTNDDGIFSEGIKLLAAALERARRRWWWWRPTASRARPGTRSPSPAAAHAEAGGELVRRRRHADRLRQPGGALAAARTARRTWSVSGINFGLNLGDDVTYSGTVSATFEGTLLGIPSVAFSQEVARGLLLRAGGRLRPRAGRACCSSERAAARRPAAQRQRAGGRDPGRRASPGWAGGSTSSR